MPEKKTVDEARKANREGKSPSTQAGAFVRGRSSTFVRESMARVPPSR